MSKLALLGGEKIRKTPFVSNACIKDEEKKRVSAVLDSGMLSGFVAKKGDFFLGGAQLREFEALVQGYFSIEYAIAVNSATAGLHIAVAACGIGAGDEVIVTPYTMSASATAIVMQKAIPVFSDITENRLCLDPARIEKKITSRTKAIMVVHLFGWPAEMHEILNIARKHNLFVIEDCAQAPGAKYKDKFVGTLGHIGVFSLNQHKTITCGEGGFAITKNSDLALRMQLVRNHGEAVVEDFGSEENYDIVGYNYRMTELEAAVSIGQFRRLDYLNSHRIELAEYLIEKLSKFKGIILPRKDDNTNVYFVLPMRLKRELVGVHRDTFVKALIAEGIPFAAGYVKPIYLAPLYQKTLKDKSVYDKGICPVCERMYEEELMLTGVCKYPHTKEDMDCVVEAFDKIYNHAEELKRFEDESCCSYRRR
ncbi:MAG: DegT/DnrJ/EryC1/StrS family aminotransferase [Candidatus Omnitrophica bacterium]|nr:DegT/DnrJ/EryC1/StrS family aminotransferase [Candidatus Omnitrophota bacterium]